MFKKMLMFVIAFSCFNVAIAQEYRPYVQLICNSEGRTSEYSGVVFKEDADNYYILTCEHGTQGHNKQIIRLKSVVAPEVEQVIKGISIESKLIKDDRDLDIALVRMAKVLGIKIKPLKLANASLMQGTECLSYGYSNGEFIRNKVSVLTYDGKRKVGSQYIVYHTLLGNKILAAEGDIIHGMSGGPLVYNNEVFGIQSSANTKTNEISYCPSDVIIKFLGEYSGN
jgi:hypothetical protein